MKLSDPEFLGAVSGILACLIFMIFHQITISNIWFSSLFMFPISAIAGYTIVKSYLAIFEKYKFTSWSGYNVYFIASLTLLSLLSVLIFTPRYTSDEILNAGGAPPDSLILNALPLTITWMVITSLGIVYGVTRTLDDLSIVLVTAAILFLTLGLNLSILGFVEVSDQHQYLVQKFLLMNIGLGTSYFLSFAFLRSFIT